jgi:uncharacterized coiled-coil protein SlyX
LNLLTESIVRKQERFINSYTKERNDKMDLETKLFIQDVQIVELNEQLAQCRAENDKLKAKLKRVQSVLDDKRVIYED